jgi:microcystin-dependent protein
MSDYFIGEIRMFAFDWPPKRWALYNGPVLPSRSHAMTAGVANGKLNGPTPGPQTYLSRQLDERTTPSTTLKAFMGAAPTPSSPPAMITPVGVAGSHKKRQPYLAMNFCISFWGEYPSFEWGAALDGCTPRSRRTIVAASHAAARVVDCCRVDATRNLGIHKF